MATWMTAGASSNATADEVLAPVLPLVRLPGNRSAIQGFTATVRVGQHDMAGYVPVEFIINSTSQFTADREFQFSLAPLPGGRIPPDRGLRVEVPVRVAEGSKSQSAVRYLPKWSAGHSYQIRLYESGELLPGYEGLLGNPVVQGDIARTEVLAQECRHDWLIIDEREVVDEQTQQLGESTFAGALTSAPIMESQLGMMGGIAIDSIGQAELPTDWRGYQRYDVVLLSMNSLKKLSSKESEFQTLRQWLINGGVVLGYDPTKDDEFIRQLGFSWTDRRQSRELVIKHAAKPIENLLAADSWRRQRKLDLERLSGMLADGADPAALGNQPFVRDAIPTPEEKEAYRIELEEMKRREQQLAELREAEPWWTFTAQQWSDRVRVQTAGAGLIIAFNDDIVGATPMIWEIVMPIVGYRISPTLRRGVDPLMGDSRFTRWLIPGVAEPPVYTFMGLLTAFVILVGPVAYRRTNRHGRGYLMFAIAPALALLTTLAMFAYGIIADGFGTVARVRQLTWLDGASGDAGERVRSTYFAGVRPGGGLNFSGDSEVIAYPQNSGRTWDQLGEISDALLGRVTVTERGQRFENAFLPSRQQRQFVIHRPRPKLGVIQFNRGDDGVATFTSTLDFPIDQVIARATDATYWTAADLAAEQTKAAEPLPFRDASRLLGKMYNDYRPLSAVREASDRSGYRRRVRDIQVAINRAIGDGSTIVTDGIFERWLRENLQLRGGIPVGYFVATAPVSNDVLAVESTELVESVRYVYGTLP